ncbi:MAG: DUF6033 family protein [Lachnospiraceae bacterium]|nr:DUF6033 family protein [Lachnospiraceae bacterium]
MGIGSGYISNSEQLYSAYGQTDTAASSYKTDKAGKSSVSSTGSYGKTIGTPQLSEEAQKYYEELKKKYSNMDFVLVGSEQKEFAKSMAGSFANPYKTVVLIDEEKIERMAVDEEFRAQYEGIISNAQSGLSQLKAQLESSGAKVQGYGMQVNDGGLTSFFAVLKKSSADQKARIEKKNAEKKAEKKAAEKKSAEKKAEEKLEEKRAEADGSMQSWQDYGDTVIITADSIEELMKKIEEYNFNERSNQVQTEEELMVGQNIDYNA